MTVDYDKAMRPNLYELMHSSGGGYVLPPATVSTLGGVIVGQNLSVNSQGRLNAIIPDMSNFATQQDLEDNVNAIFETIGYRPVYDTSEYPSYAFKLYDDGTFTGYFKSTVQASNMSAFEVEPFFYDDLTMTFPTAFTDVATVEFNYVANIVLQPYNEIQIAIVNNISVNADDINFRVYSTSNANETYFASAIVEGLYTPVQNS